MNIVAFTGTGETNKGSVAGALIVNACKEAFIFSCTKGVGLIVQYVFERG